MGGLIAGCFNYKLEWVKFPECSTPLCHIVPTIYLRCTKKKLVLSLNCIYGPNTKMSSNIFICTFFMFIYQSIAAEYITSNLQDPLKPHNAS